MFQKKTISAALLLLLTGILFPHAIAQESKYMLGILNYNAYCTDKQEPYIEFQFIIDGNTTHYVPASADTYAAEVDVQVDICQKNESGQDEMIGQLHYILVSPQIRDTVPEKGTYFSDTRNVQVPNGDYFLYFRLKDIHGTSDTLKYIDFIQVNFPGDKISTSNISMYERLSASGEGGVFFKYGYALTPLFQQYAPEKIFALPFTFEIYNTEKVLGPQQDFLVKCEIEEIGHLPKPEYTEIRSVKSAPVSVFLHFFNIYKLPSGNYNLNVYVMNQDSVVLASSSAFFQRSNPSVQLNLSDYDDVVVEHTFVEKMTNLKQLQEDVASLYPIASKVEQDFYSYPLKKVSLGELQRYFYNFWVSRDPHDPEGAWNEYKKKLDYVQKNYGSSVIKGYRTDRGRVYLQYGPPTSITSEEFDPQAYPYEIWHYYVLGRQTNVKFIFYNRDLATNNYELLHSDYVGETYDPLWQMKLVNRLSPNSNPDIRTPEDYWGGNARDHYKYNE